MHPSSIFRVDDDEKSFAFMSQNPFAVLAVNHENGPVTALVPLVLDENGADLLGHVARKNPFWKAAQSSEKAVAVFQSSDAYVSPSVYASKKEHGKAVPTWNYIALEVRGKIEVEPEPSKMTPYLQTLTSKMESHRETPWQLSDTPKDYYDKLSRAIVGFRLSIDQINHVRKLSQNKSAEDRDGVIASFEESGNSREISLAKEMKKTGLRYALSPFKRE